MTRTNRIYGTSIVTGALCLIVTGMFHPNAGRALESTESLRAFIWTNTTVHSLAIFGVWLSLLGLVGLSKELNLTRPASVAALSAYLIGAVLVCFAATFDGLVIPVLLRRVLQGDELQKATTLPLVGFATLVASSLTSVYVATVSLAMVLWSALLHKTGAARVLAWSGAAIALLGAVGLISGALRLDRHGLLAVVLVQGAWFIAAGVWLARRADKSSSQTVPTE